MEHVATKMGNEYTWLGEDGSTRNSIATYEYGRFGGNTCSYLDYQAWGGYTELHTIMMTCPVCDQEHEMHHSESGPAMLFKRKTYTEISWYYKGFLIHRENMSL